jgi:hypothetical protein
MATLLSLYLANITPACEGVTLEYVRDSNKIAIGWQRIAKSD